MLEFTGNPETDPAVATAVLGPEVISVNLIGLGDAISQKWTDGYKIQFSLWAYGNHYSAQLYTDQEFSAMAQGADPQDAVDRLVGSLAT